MARLSALLFALALTLIAAQKLRGNTGSAAPGRMSSCKGSFCDGVPDDRFAVLLEKGRLSVFFGHNPCTEAKCVEKCVNVTTPVVCDSDAADLGKRLNDDDHPDTYEVTVKADAMQVCCRRTDSKKP